LLVLFQIKGRQHARMFLAHRFELFGLEIERLQDRRRHLLVLDPFAHDLAVKLRVGDDQQHVGVVVRKTAVLGDLLLARAVDRAGDGLDDDVRSASQRRVSELFHRSSPAKIFWMRA
jgi:hypothetical protein